MEYLVSLFVKYKPFNLVCQLIQIEMQEMNKSMTYFSLRKACNSLSIVRMNRSWHEWRLASNFVGLY